MHLASGRARVYLATVLVVLVALLAILYIALHPGASVCEFEELTAADAPVGRRVASTGRLVEVRDDALILAPKDSDSPTVTVRAQRASAPPGFGLGSPVQFVGRLESPGLVGGAFFITK